ncbi:hypothetical protein ANN_09295 [Periplaneta americana]|uniref:DUF4817 domain-containing protein n=1 Tax=Periplaneta americana TaxID=6978 RepID=A0ABQ8TME9_PERAM|nr:hypothetical protein ANN_09295 [Periplaneta americana]
MKAQTVLWYAEFISIVRVQRKYRRVFNHDAPTAKSIKKWHYIFLATGSVLKKHGGGRKTSDEMVANVQAAYERSPRNWLFNDAVSTTRLFSVDEIGDSEMVFGEMWPRFRLRLPSIHLTVGENLGKNPTRSVHTCGDNGHRVWPRNQVARVRIPVGSSYLVEFFPGFSLNPIRANAGCFPIHNRLKMAAPVKRFGEVYSESHRSGGINDATLQRNKEQNCWKDRWLSWRLYKLLSLLR